MDNRDDSSRLPDESRPSDYPPRGSRPDTDPSEYGIPWAVCLVVVFAVLAFGIGPAVFSEEYDSDPAEDAALEVLEEMCDKPKPVPGAAPYSGKGPHLYQEFGNEDLDTIPMDAEFDPFEYVPAKWSDGAYEDIELVVCVDIELKTALTECDYEVEIFKPGELNPPGDGELITAEVHATDYRFRLYSASTGELVYKTTKHVDDPTCPDEVKNVEESDTHDIAAALGDNVTKEVLEPWVTKTVK